MKVGLAKFLYQAFIFGLISTTNLIFFSELVKAANNTPSTPTSNNQRTLLSQRGGDSAYILGPGDRLKIDVFNVPEYSGEFQVLVDGTLNLPVIGSVNVRGATIPQATAIIQQRYARLVRTPIVTVNILVPRPLQVTVAGEVNRAGSYTITLTDNRSFPTVSQAIQQAGGVTQRANLNSVILQRGGQRYTINIFNVLQGAQDLKLRDGDQIFVPTARSMSDGELQRLLNSNLTNQDLSFNITVVGEVIKPGSYIMKGDAVALTGGSNRVTPPKLVEAIKQSGGVTLNADLRRVIVQRGGGNYAVDLYALLDPNRGASTNSNISLRDGDRIVIPRNNNISDGELQRLLNSNLTNQDLNFNVTIVGEVVKPGTYTIKGESSNISGGNTRITPPKLTELIKQAGGATLNANLSQVVVQRASGEPITANLLALLTGNGGSGNNVSLRDGDRIIIPSSGQTSPSYIRQLSELNLVTQDVTVKVAVVGEVVKPGTYTIKGEVNTGTTGRVNLPTVTEAIKIAGGATNTADISQIQVIRVDRTGNKRAIPINLADFLRNGNIDQDLVLQEGDVVKVTTASEIDNPNSTLLANSTIAAQLLNPVKIAIVGEVNRPGTYTLKGDNTATTGSAATPPTMTQALQSAGGITSMANIKSIRLVRTTRSGEKQEKTFDLWSLLTTGDFSQDIILQDGDRITIPEAKIDPKEADLLARASFSPTNIKVNVVGELDRPATTTTTIEVPANTTLNQAILIAGGFDNARANKSTANLLRLNRDGSVSKRVINLDFNKGIDEAINPRLQNNDIIVIGRSNLTRIGDGLGTVLNPIGNVLSLFNIFRLLR